MSGGLRLGAGAKYLLLLVRDEDELRLAPCGPSQEIRPSARLEQLLSYSPAPTATPSPAALMLVMAAALIGGLIAFFAFGQRRRP